MPIKPDICKVVHALEDQPYKLPLKSFRGYEELYIPCDTLVAFMLGSPNVITTRYMSLFPRPKWRKAS